MTEKQLGANTFAVDFVTIPNNHFRIQYMYGAGS